MQDYYDTNPELTKEDLIRSFKDEFGGKIFYVIKSSCGIKADLVLPEFDSFGELNYSNTWISVNELDVKGLDLVHNEICTLSAINNPKLYRRLIRNNEGLKLLTEIEEKINKLSMNPEFSWLKINLENNDLSMTIGWNDNTVTGIL